MGKNLGRVAGWFAVYVAVGGLLAFLAARDQAPFRLFAAGFTPPPTCLPQREMFGLIESRCPIAVVNGFWFIAAGLPRLVIVLAGWAILLPLDLRSVGNNPLDPAALLYVVLAGGGSALVFTLGIRHWLRRDRRVAALTAILLIFDVAVYVIPISYL